MIQELVNELKILVKKFWSCHFELEQFTSKVGESKRALLAFILKCYCIVLSLPLKECQNPVKDSN
jgi:hypothetical protein